jgi:hypothetical protein
MRGNPKHAEVIAKALSTRMIASGDWGHSQLPDRQGDTCRAFGLGDISEVIACDVESVDADHFDVCFLVRLQDGRFAFAHAVQRSRTIHEGCISWIDHMGFSLPSVLARLSPEDRDRLQIEET